MLSERERLSAVARIGFIGSILVLLGLIIIIYLINPRIGFLTGIGLFGMAWLIICLKYPLWSFNFLLFIFILVYVRLKVGGIEVDGPGNRGAIAIGDILWLTMLFAFAMRSLISKSKLRFHITINKQPLSMVAMLPYVILATGLPIMGVLLGGWPISYAIPGLRQLQWVSFAIIAYNMVRSYNSKSVLRGVFVTIAIATLIHTIYAIVQLGYSIGWLSRTWVILDSLFSKNNVNNWFYYPRLTGLFVNPNSYGVFGAFVLIVALAIVINKVVTKSILPYSVLISGGFALVFSASRSALLGLGIALMMIICVAFLSPMLMKRMLKVGIPVVVIGLIIFTIIIPVIPEVLQARFSRFTKVFSIGASADPNAIGRVDMWKDLWQTYITKYPLGTWVPTSYATYLAP